jgi:hypothetical protein
VSLNPLRLGRVVHFSEQLIIVDTSFTERNDDQVVGMYYHGLALRLGIAEGGKRLSRKLLPCELASTIRIARMRSPGRGLTDVKRAEEENQLKPARHA